MLDLRVSIAAQDWVAFGCSYDLASVTINDQGLCIGRSLDPERLEPEAQNQGAFEVLQAEAVHEKRRATGLDRLALGPEERVPLTQSEEEQVKAPRARHRSALDDHLALPGDSGVRRTNGRITGEDRK
jgi:hypothetical protein